ncbi:MAG: hypothetical protein AAGN66_21920 [Acidobacteriota bacterium]
MASTAPDPGEPRFAVATFQRVFDVEPKRDVVTLEQLASGLTRFLVKPKTAATVEREVSRIEATWSRFEAGEYVGGRQGSRLLQAARRAEAEGRDPSAAARAERDHLLSEARSAPKRDLRLWSPAWYPEGSRRGSEHVLHLSCLVLDYDSGVSVREAGETWRDYFHVVHTTWSHTPEHPKLRLVLPLAQPVLPADWDAVYGWAQERTGHAVDPTGRSVGTTFALPAVADPAAPRIAHVAPGPLFAPRLEGLVQQVAEPPPVVECGEPNHFRFSIPGHRVVEGSYGEPAASAQSPAGDTDDDPWDDPEFPWS